MEEADNAERYQLHSVLALVEYEDGTMSRVWPTSVQFADSEQYFTEYDWDAMEAQRDALPFTYSKEVAAASTQAVAKNCLTCGAPTQSCECNCESCQRDGCRCRYCQDNNLWVPKGGTT